MNAVAPVLIAFDGSNAARQAVREGASLTGSRQALVLTVWEPGMEFRVAPIGDLGISPPVVDVGAAQVADDALRARASRIAQDGAELAKSVGLDAEALALPGGNPAEIILELARERNVAAIIIGSRGLSGLRARFEGSTSNAVLKHSPCPVVVVHHDEP